MKGDGVNFFHVGRLNVDNCGPYEESETVPFKRNIARAVEAAKKRSTEKLKSKIETGRMP